MPTIFLKLTSALNGPRSAVVLPKLTQQPDYEAEFAFVIGKGGKNISADTWEEHVFGYTIMNDVSARDVQMATSQWSLGKSFDTFAPLGRLSSRRMKCRTRMRLTSGSPLAMKSCSIRIRAS